MELLKKILYAPNPAFCALGMPSRGTVIQKAAWKSNCLSGVIKWTVKGWVKVCLGAKIRQDCYFSVWDTLEFITYVILQGPNQSSRFLILMCIVVKERKSCEGKLCSFHAQITTLRAPNV